MAMQFNLISLADLARGLDLRSAESRLADGFCEDLQNVDTNSSGVLQKRKGYEGYAGYIPFRVREVQHDNFHINFKLAAGVDLSGIASSPINVYGKLSTSESGDFSTTAALVKYPAFSVDVRDTFTPSITSSAKTATDTGVTSDNLFVYTMLSTSESNSSNSFVLNDGVTISSSTYTTTVSYNTLSTEQVYIAIIDKATVSGSSYTADYSSAPISPSSGTVTGVITAATHGLSNFNIIPKLYTLSGTTYSEFWPDMFNKDAFTGDVDFSFLSSSNFDGQIVLSAATATNYAEVTVNGLSTGTITISNIEGNFPYWALYFHNGSNRYLTIPDSVVVDDAANTITVSIVNADVQAATFSFFYDYAEIPANTIRVVDSSATTAAYTGTVITNPQLSIWGINHSDHYSTDTGGRTTHLDSYKREAEARLIAGLGGNLFAARTRTEVGTTYGMPQLTVDLDARIDSTVALAPLFQVTGTSSSVRTRGIITGDNVSGGYAVVTGVSYVSSGVVDYTISLTNKSGTLAINTQIATTDYLTVAGMANDVHNGTFQISSVTSQSSSGVVLRVSNSLATLADWDETGAAGTCNVFTDKFTTTTSTNYIPSDRITAASISSSLTLLVKSVSTTSVTVSGVTESINLTSGLTIFGVRSSYVQPLKDSAGTASISGLVKGDIVTVLDLDNSPRVTYINPFQDLSCTITVASSVATVSVGSAKTVSSIDTATNVFTSSSHGFSDNDPVYVTTTGTMPASLRSDCTYFIDYLSTNTFKLAPKENGSALDITSAGSGTITVTRVHNLAVGQRVTISQTGDRLLDGVQTVVATAARNTFTYATTSTTSSTTGVMVGKTAEFDESLTFTDALGAPTSVTVTNRWIPIEIPSVSSSRLPVANSLPATTYVNHFSDTETQLRSCVVASTMFFLNQQDQVMKFDGDSLYQAGLFRWQPHLFTQVDTTTGTLTLDAVSGTVTAVTDNRFKLDLTFGHQFSVGQRVVHSQDGGIYTIQSIDLSDTGPSGVHYIFVTSTITGSGSGTLKLVKTYKYYFRLNAIDANNNIIASASTGSIESTVELAASGQLHHKLVGMPAWGNYDYDRLELQVYRNIADTPSIFYLIKSIPVTFASSYNYIDVYDATTDLELSQRSAIGDDSVMVALTGAELGNTWEQPPRAKYLCAINNRLVLGNIKDYQQLTIDIRKQATGAIVTAANLSGFTFLFRKDSTDTSTSTNNLARMKYEYVTSGSLTISGITGTGGVGFAVTTSTNHGLSVGNWVYLYYTASAADNDLHYCGWWQVNAVGSVTVFSVLYAGSPNGAAGAGDFPNRCALATTKTDVPVWLGTDGNYAGLKYGNTTASYEGMAATRLANAINATQVAIDYSVTGQSTYTPWMVAGAGSEYPLGHVTIRVPKYSSTTLECELGTLGSNYDIYINGIKKASSSATSATTAIFPSRVCISYENYPELFDNPCGDVTDSDSAVDVNSADGEEIVGVIPFFGESAFGQSSVESLVVVFKTNSIYLLDVTSRKVQKIDSQGLGCTAPYSIAATRAGIMFANLSGIYRLNRNLTISYVGKFLERYWKDTVNASQLSIATGHNFGIGRQYKLSVPIDENDSNSVVLVYDHTREGQDQEFGAWSKYTNHAATGWCNLNTDSYFSTTTGQVFKIRSVNDETDYRDDASAVAEMVILLKSTDGGMPGVRKACRAIISHVRMHQTDVTGTVISAATENSTTFETVGTIDATLGTSKIITFRDSLPTPKFVYISIKYTNSVKDENFVLAGIDYLLAALGVQGVAERTELD